MLVRATPEGEALRERAEGIPHAVACATTLPLDELAELRARVQSLLHALDAAGA